MIMITKIRRYIVRVLAALSDARSVGIRAEVRHLRDVAAVVSPKHLLPFGYKVYAQTDEDGIIAEIFRRIGTTARRFVECGIGDGLENNTAALIFDGWRGLWIDASTTHVAAVRRHWSRLIAEGTLTIVQALVTVDNINQLIHENCADHEIDLLSIDIDGNDWHVLKAVSTISPRVVVVEYNAKFRPPIKYCMAYDPEYAWDGTDCHGASLQVLADGMSEKGYALVGCSISGTNAFFVRGDLVGDLFLEPFTAVQHYQEARYHLTRDVSGHPAGYAALAGATRAEP